MIPFARLLETVDTHLYYLQCRIVVRPPKPVAVHCLACRHRNQTRRMHEGSSPERGSNNAFHLTALPLIKMLQGLTAGIQRAASREKAPKKHWKVEWTSHLRLET